MAEILSMGDYPENKIPKENLIKVFIEKFNSLDRFFKIQILSITLIMLVIPVAVGGLIFDTRQRASGPTTTTIYDLKSYYPNPDLFKNYYLEGKNYLPNASSPSRSVLWFEPQDQWSFKLYNSAPSDPIYARCNWDLLSWWDDGFLRYSKTHNDCPGSTPNDIVYDPPIIFLPKVWNSTTPWSLSASSSATYSENGVVKCTGIINYTGKILGIEQIATNEPGIHWNTAQTTSWTSGNVPGKCATGSITNWQEDYWLTDILPIQNGSTAKGLKRSKGGNIDITSDNWDVLFDSWNLLNPTTTPTPTASPSPTPIITPTPIPTPSPTPLPKDTTPPKISITNPLNGSQVRKNSFITISAIATDNMGISKVVFYVNGSQKCSDTTYPYGCTWQVPNLAKANYTISAFAYDSSNNNSSSTVQVKSK
jgi:hypothetical protein